MRQSPSGAAVKVITGSVVSGGSSRHVPVARQGLSKNMKLTRYRRFDPPDDSQFFGTLKRNRRRF